MTRRYHQWLNQITTTPLFFLSKVSLRWEVAANNNLLQLHHLRQIIQSTDL